MRTIPRPSTASWSTTSSSSLPVKPSRAGRTSTKWIEGFLAEINNLHLEVIESFQNADGSRVASRWLLTGQNNGFAGTAPDQQEIRMTGTAVWAVREDGKLLSNHVERAALEQYRRLSAS